VLIWICWYNKLEKKGGKPMASLLLEGERYDDVTRIAGTVTREGTESPHPVKYYAWIESSSTPFPGDLVDGIDTFADVLDLVEAHTPPL
jgi:hypothetical protein